VPFDHKQGKEKGLETTPIHHRTAYKKEKKTTKKGIYQETGEAFGTIQKRTIK